MTPEWAGRAGRLLGLTASSQVHLDLVDEQKRKRRIARAHETQEALERVQNDPRPENTAALHRLHAEHLREDGDLDGAAEAEARADRVEAAAAHD